MVKLLIRSLISPYIAAKLFSKGIFVSIYATYKVGRSYTVNGYHHDRSLEQSVNDNNELVMMYGDVYLRATVKGDALSIVEMFTAHTGTVAAARDAIHVIRYIIANYSKVDPGIMSQYSAKLYWSCVHKFK